MTVSLDASRWCILGFFGFLFPTCGLFGSCWDNLIDAAPEVYDQSGCFSSLTECCPWGNPDVSCSVGDRPIMGLQLRARVLGAPDDHPRASLGFVVVVLWCMWRSDGVMEDVSW
jgi:hypothetical protein